MEEINQTSAYHKVRLFTVARYAADKPVAELEEKNILQQWAISSKGIDKYEFVGKSFCKS